MQAKKPNLPLVPNRLPPVLAVRPWPGFGRLVWASPRFRIWSIAVSVQAKGLRFLQQWVKTVSISGARLPSTCPALSPLSESQSLPSRNQADVCRRPGTVRMVGDEFRSEAPRLGERIKPIYELSTRFKLAMAGERDDPAGKPGNMPFQRTPVSTPGGGECARAADICG